MERRLTAILAADVVGYSRLMGENEAGTLTALKSHRRELIDPTVSEHNGRIVKLMGDGALVEFPSVIEAVQCAVEVQMGMSTRNVGVPKEIQIQFRIGINLGDVIVEGDDIYGDGVNIAARLEALAVPGGIYVSRTVFEHVKNKVKVRFKDLGAQDVKNIPEPVRIYSILLDGGTPESVERATKRGFTRVRAIGFATVALMVIAGLLLGWWQAWKPDFEPASVARMAFALSEKPSIAVIPFQNLSDGNGSDALVDALSELLIAIVGKLPNAFVIATDSSFKLAEKAIEVHEISERLGVRYVFEGIYEKANGVTRITARLSDALKGNHIWSETFDVAAEDFFAFQNKIANVIASSLQLTGNPVVLAGPPTNSHAAWSLHVEALAEKRKWDREANANARDLWAKAVTRDPDFTFAWLSIGWTHWADVLLGWSQNVADSIKNMEAVASKVLEIDPGSAEANELLGAAYLFKMDHNKALEFGAKAVALNPNSADALARLSIAQNVAGRPEEAQRLIEAAMRLNPYYPFWYLHPRAEAYRFSGRYREAIETVKEELRLFDNYFTRTRLAIYYSQSDQGELAKAEIRKAREGNPRMTLSNWTEARFFMGPTQISEDLAALKKAGLPEILNFECLVRDKCL